MTIMEAIIKFSHNWDICGLTLSENNIWHTNKFINQFTKMDVDLVRNIVHILLFARVSASLELSMA